MLQLGGSGMTMGARFSRTAPESFLGDAGASHEGISAPLKQELLETMEVCTPAEEAVAMEDNFNSMAIDGSVEESPYASHAVRPGAPHHAMRPSSQNPTHLGVPHQSLAPGYSVHPPHNKSVAPQVSFYRGHEAGRSAQPTHFLDACLLCSKRLGHGRDVFIYRGDRAFCSVECRQLQIVADEMGEKCGMAVAKEGAGVNTQASNPPSTNQVETAAAA